MDKTENNCWFVLAHCFNMDGRAASQTITDRIPYFYEKGINLVVLSAPIGRLDDRFPHYQVFSAFPSGLLFEGRHLISQKFKTKTVQKLLKALLTLILLPFYLAEVAIIHLDSQWSWFVGATVKGFWIVRKHKPRLLYSTAGPPSTHVAAFFLKKIYGLPWLAEVHDPLIYDKEPRKWQYHYFKKWLEKTICRHADAVIYFTDRALACAQKRNDFCCKGHVLRPGAEPPAFSDVAYVKKDKIHFGHFGSLAANRNLKMVFQAIFELVEENPHWKDLICVDIYGTELDIVSRESLSSFPLGSMLCEHGRLEYDPSSGKSGRQRVIEAMCQSDVLLLIHGEGIICDEYIPSKYYEYLLTGRPVIGIAEKGSELDNMLIENECSNIDLNDLDGLKQWIRNYVAQWQGGGIPYRKERSPFTVRNAVDRILSIVSEM